ncbi:MAG TPA: hypothetical protein VEU32_01990 [Burkholderiales bacterium]|nr:hypothetical protein [Burkholderiales bacterium]
MKKIVVVVLALMLAACSSYEVSNIEGTIVRPGNFIAGSGVVVGVGVLPHANKGNAHDPNLYRISLHMDQGGFQQVDTDNNTFAEGQAVELTNDGRIVHVSGTTANRAVR